MMKSLLALIVFFLANAAFAADEATTQPQTINFFDPAAWMQMSQQGNAGVPQGATMAFNPFHPSGWAAFVSPQTHEQAHMAFLNPANYAQFMQPQFYMQAMNPNNWMAWMNPASYGAFMNPATYNYWMNPAAYGHMMNPAQYMQAMNPNAFAPYMNPALYMQWTNPAAYQPVAAANMTAANMTPGFNMFDPKAWGQVFNTAPKPVAKKDAPAEK